MLSFNSQDYQKNRDRVTHLTFYHLEHGSKAKLIKLFNKKFKLVKGENELVNK